MKNVLYHFFAKTNDSDSHSVRINYNNYLSSLLNKLKKIKIDKIYCLLTDDINSKLKDVMINKEYGFNKKYLENSLYLSKVIFIDMQNENKYNEIFSEDLKTKNVYCVFSSKDGDISKKEIMIVKHKRINYITDDLELQKKILDIKTPYHEIDPKPSINEMTEFLKALPELIKNFYSSKVSIDFNKIYTCNFKMLSLIEFAEHLSEFEHPVLITGETGTGKELFANAIHNSSKRSKSKFYPVNTAAHSDELFASEMFGTIKGAFTSAIDKEGYFEKANGSTIFLDEIGDISLFNQAKLLRILQEKKFTRVGGTKEINSDFRLICATNKDLSKMVKENTFREDLYYRLKTFTIHLPPLRERGEKDIKELLLKIFSDKVEKFETIKNLKFTESSLKILCDYDWPGNVRELENFILNVIARFTFKLKGMNNISEDMRNFLIKYGNKFINDIDDSTVNDILDLKQNNNNILSEVNVKEKTFNLQQNQVLEEFDLKHKLEMIEKDEIIKALNIVNKQDKAGIIIGYNQKKMSRLIKKYNIKYK